MKPILLAMGTRPEAIKLSPLVPALRERGLEPRVLATGRDRGPLRQALDDYGIAPAFDIDLTREEQPLTDLFARLTEGVGKVLREDPPAAVIAEGGAATALAASLAAFYEGIPLAHVEAGLRSNRVRSPFPEELHRRAISLLADLHFAPTPSAKRNLLAEGIEERRVHLVGNTVIDALQYSLKQPETAEWDLPPRLTPILFTAHRREHFGEAMRGMFRAARRIAEEHADVVVICPLPADARVREAAKEAEGCDRVRLIEPPSPIRFHRLLSRCKLVMTDSGGIQEEVTALGIPTVVMRYSTERTEGVRAGCLMLCGTHEDGIVAAVNALLRPGSELYASMCHPSDVFGDGHAAERIAGILAEFVNAAERGAAR